MKVNTQRSKQTSEGENMEKNNQEADFNFERIY